MNKSVCVSNERKVTRAKWRGGKRDCEDEERGRESGNECNEVNDTSAQGERGEEKNERRRRERNKVRNKGK